jgi:hypothetical protein
MILGNFDAFNNSNDFLQSNRIIENLAYQCPSIYGPAVYHARGLMEVLEQKGYNYVNACEINYPDDISNARLGKFIEAWEGNGEPDFSDLPNESETGFITNFSFYPNPASKQLFVTLPTDNKSGSYEIFNATGTLVSSGNLNNVVGLNTVDIKQLADGLYLLKINGYKGQSFIVKQ